MTRWAIGLSIWVCLAVSVAHAAPGERCACEAPEITLPRPGATNVPRNTKLWAIGRYYVLTEELQTAAGSSIAIVPTAAGNAMHAVTRYDLPDLAPHREYTTGVMRAGPATHFTTGEEVDLVAPATPVIRSAGIAITPPRDDEHGQLGDLQLDAAYDPDTALIRIEIIGGREPITILTVPGDWQSIGKPACSTEMALHPGDHVQIAITAIDLAGNESKAAIQQVEVTAGLSPIDPCAVWPHHIRCGIAWAMIMFGLLICSILAAAAIIACIWGYLSRRRALRAAVTEPVSSLAAEHLLRRKQFRAGLVAVLGFSGLVAFGLQSGDRNSWLWFLSPILVGIGGRGVLAARACLAMIDGGADAMSLAHRLVVTTGDVEKSVDLDVETIARARVRYAVPRSTARSRAGRARS